MCYIDAMNDILDAAPTPKIKYKPRYIRRSRVKELALATAKAQLGPTRQKMFTIVGTSFYEACDAFLANFIAHRVKSHPSKGKTLM